MPRLERLACRSPRRLLAAACPSRLLSWLVLTAASAAPMIAQAQVPPQDPAPVERRWPWDRGPETFEPDAGGRAAGLVSGSPWSLSFSPATWHSNYKPEHAHSVGVGLRRAIDGRQFVGLNAFNNSFGQPSAYAMYGQRLYGGVPAAPKFYVEWTAGMLYGYVGERAKEVPLNVRGFSPAFTLSPGWQFTPQFSMQANVIGSVAIMVQFDWRFR